MGNTIFRTQYKLKSEEKQLDYSSEILLFGSCFSENINKKLEYYKFNSTLNPYGILFHPAAIEKAILECLENKIYTDEHLIFHKELWHSFQHHSNFSGLDKQQVLDKINTTINKTHKKLKSATHIIITLGTSWVYEYLEQELTVANCHKIPQKKFRKKILTVEGSTRILENIKKQIRSINPKVNFIFTLSPVRHLKDGMVENAQSKAQLLSAIHNVIDAHSFYFPSYEIMLDDLRDYRFYKRDMIHPNATAIDYIWDNFKATWISKATERNMFEVDAIQKALQHKAFYPESAQHKKFLEDLKNRILKLEQQYNILF